MSKEYQDIKAKQTILQHGESVRSKFLEILNHIESSKDSEYKLANPKWILQYSNILYPILKQHKSDIETYLLYHECGKPSCLEIDENSRRHFTQMFGGFDSDSFKIKFKNLDKLG